MRRFRRPLVLALALAVAAPVGAEVVTERARGAVPLWEEGEVPEGQEAEAAVPARRRALRAAIAEAVAIATRKFVEEQDPYLDPEMAVEALGEPEDRLRYAERYRVIRDEGRGPASEGIPTKEEYALEVEAQVDLALVRKQLTEAQFLLFEAPAPVREQQVIVLEGDFSYASYAEIRRSLGELGVEIGPHAFSPGQVRMELDSPRSPEELIPALRSRVSNHIYLDAVGQSEDALRVKVVERIPPEPTDLPSATP